MSSRDDVNNLYKIPNILNGIEVGLFIIDFIAAVIALSGNQQVVSVAIIIQIVASLFYFIISVIDDGYFWYEAEKARRINSIENGLGIRLSELETEGYYNNQIKESIEKYALNVLESNYFSKFISGKMFLISSVKSAIAVVVLVVSCRFMTDSSFLLIIAQTTLSSYVLLDTVMLIIYKVRMDNLYKDGYKLLISPKLGIGGKKKTACILAYVVEYESIKAHYKIRLSEKKYNKYNDKLSDQWKHIQSHND